MKKIYFLFALYLSFIPALFARDRVNLTTKQVNVSYIQLPKKPIKEKKNRTYSVETRILAHQTAYDAKSISNELIISELTTLEKDAYLQVYLEFSPFSIIKLEKVEKKRSKKTPTGETKEYYEYYYEIDYKITLNVTVKDEYGKGGQSNYVKGGVRQSYSTLTFNSAAELETYYKTNADDIQFKLKNDFIANSKKEVFKKINDDYGYQKVQTELDIYLLQNKTHNEYIPFQDAFNNVNRVFASMQYEEPFSNAEAELKSTIDFYQDILKKYSANKRKQAKLRFVALYNLTYIYFYMDKFTQAKVYAQEMINNEKYISGTYQGKKAYQEIVDTELLVKMNNVENRHVTPN